MFETSIAKGYVKVVGADDAELVHVQAAHRMQQKARRTENFLYVDCLEAYTSRTCSECGTVRPGFHAETFECVNAACGIVVNRDQNAAKNIIIRSGYI